MKIKYIYIKKCLCTYLTKSAFCFVHTETLSKIKFCKQTTITPANFLKLTSVGLFLSLTVDTQLFTSLYGCTQDVHFYWLNAEMIDILRQRKSTIVYSSE